MKLKETYRIYDIDMATTSNLSGSEVLATEVKNVIKKSYIVYC